MIDVTRPVRVRIIFPSYELAVEFFNEFISNDCVWAYVYEAGTDEVVKRFADGKVEL